MIIDVPLEIDDVIWVIDVRTPKYRTITGVKRRRYHNRIVTQYLTERYEEMDIDLEYFKSEKDAEIEIARKILEGLKDGN